MKQIEIQENGLNVIFVITDENELKLLHFSALPFDPTSIHSRSGNKAFHPVEIMVTGQDRPEERHGNKYVVTAPGYRLKYKDYRDTRNQYGRKLEFIMFDQITGIEVVCHYQFFSGISAVRSWTEIFNRGEESQGIEYVSSFALTGIEKEGLLPADQKMRLYLPHNGWQREMQWEICNLPQKGLADCQPISERRSSNTFGISNTGNWSTKEYLPMGWLENQETHSGLFWQIEHNGSWHWEISDQEGLLYLQLSGPTEIESHWWKSLKQGEYFVSVPVCVGAVCGGFDQGIAELTKYRRAIRRNNRDNENLPVIFNDYMNCLWGDPTTEKEIPLIDAAAKVGCEYYCIDCGWYSDGYWWDGVGEWLPCERRFPGGLKKLMDYIREKGMTPGVWLELEVMGIHCPKAERVSEAWFFQRHGKRVHDRSRYQLDFRNPEVIEHANEVIDRLVQEYGVGYIKMDYNIEPGIGTDLDCDSCGDGLLEHNRAYLAWLDRVFERYPDLVIENCSSGGMRIDYAMLSRYSIQSTSDQEDYRYYATIAANAPTALTPEQSAIWSYPLAIGDEEETAFNMVNAMLMRIHQSGNLEDLSEQRLLLVREGIECYKDIREDIKQAVPFWPLGLSEFSDTWISVGLKEEDYTYLAVWRRGSETDTVTLPISHFMNQNIKVDCIYPKQLDVKSSWNPSAGTLSVTLPNSVSARLFRLSAKERLIG